MKVILRGHRRSTKKWGESVGKKIERVDKKRPLPQNRKKDICNALLKTNTVVRYNEKFLHDEKIKWAK